MDNGDRLIGRMAFDFSKYQAVLLDLDGTLFKEDQPLPGAVGLLRRLLTEGRTVGCPSNSTESPQRMARRIAGMGVEIRAESIFTAAHAAVEYCVERFAPRPRVFSLATEGVAEMLAGRTHEVRSEHELCDAVVIGNPECVDATPPRMGIAMRLLRQGAACVGICDDRAYPSPRGLEIGSGGMTRMLAYAAAVEPVFFGKPQRRFFEHVCRRLNVRPEHCVLIGDNLESDIGGAKGVGMGTILVLTGVSSRADAQRLPPQMRPDSVVANLTEL